jgi:hypothetical protein
LPAGVGDAAQGQDLGDVGQVLGARLDHRGLVRHVVFAVGHAQAALQQERRVLGGVVERRRDPQAQHVVGVEVGGVQGVDVGADIAAQHGANCFLSLIAAMRARPAFSGVRPLGLDGGLVHVAGVVVADLLAVPPPSLAASWIRSTVRLVGLSTMIAPMP